MTAASARLSGTRRASAPLWPRRASRGAAGVAGERSWTAMGGDDVLRRRPPSLADRLGAWPEGTRLQSLDEPATGDGVEWQKVRDPRGNVGYVPTRYLARE